jgi:hypothetical protein
VKGGGNTRGSCSAYPTLKMEAMGSFKKSVDFQRTARRYIPRDSTPLVSKVSDAVEIVNYYDDFYELCALNILKINCLLGYDAV